MSIYRIFNFTLEPYFEILGHFYVVQECHVAMEISFFQMIILIFYSDLLRRLFFSKMLMYLSTFNVNK